MAPIITMFKSSSSMVITSNQTASMAQFARFIVSNWSEIMVRNTRLLFLGGVHGDEEGQVGRDDSRLLGDLSSQFRRFHDQKGKEIQRDGITILQPLDVGQFKKKKEGADGMVVDGKELSKKIRLLKTRMFGCFTYWNYGEPRTLRPTVLVLAFCWTTVSELNTILTSMGIYSMLFLQRERGAITENRCIFLSQAQEDFLCQVSEQQPRHVMLSGHFGSGKTLLLCEVLKMKVAHYQQSTPGVPIRVVVASTSVLSPELDREASEVFPEEELDGRALPHLMGHLAEAIRTQLEGAPNVILEFYISFKEATRGTLRSMRKVREAQKAARCLSTEYPNDRVILMVDEVVNSEFDVHDWKSFQTDVANVDILVSFHPGVVWGNAAGDISGFSVETAFFFLDKVYRNSPEVLTFCDFVQTHGPTRSSIVLGESKEPPPVVTLDAGHHDYPRLLPNAAREELPEGSPVCWVDVGSGDEMVRQAQVSADRCTDEQRVIFVMPEELRSHHEWRRQDRARTVGAPVSLLGKRMRGLEADVLVIVDADEGGDSMLLELLTRARKTAIVITSQRKGRIRELLESAAQHAEGKSTSCPRDCPFMGHKNLIQVKNDIASEN